MAKNKKPKTLPTQAEIMASTRRQEAYRPGQKFADRKLKAKNFRKAKHKGKSED